MDNLIQHIKFLCEKFVNIDSSGEFMERAKELATKVLTKKRYHTFVYFYEFGNYIKQKSRWFRALPYYDDLIGIYMILLEVENSVNPSSHNVIDHSFDDVVRVSKHDWLSRIQIAMKVYYEKDKTPIADTMAKMMLLEGAQERNEHERSLISLLQEGLQRPGDHPSVHQLQQPQRKRRHRAGQSDLERRARLAPGVGQPVCFCQRTTKLDRNRLQPAASALDPRPQNTRRV
jgi:hypothetical protein